MKYLNKDLTYKLNINCTHTIGNAKLRTLNTILATFWYNLLLIRWAFETFAVFTGRKLAPFWFEWRICYKIICQFYTEQLSSRVRRKLRLEERIRFGRCLIAIVLTYFSASSSSSQKKRKKSQRGNYGECKIWTILNLVKTQSEALKL